MMRTMALLVVLVTAACAPGAGSSSSGGSSGGSSSGTADAGPPIPTLGTTAELQRITTHLAEDAMNGREPGTTESATARAYIKDLMIQCRLVPAGTDGYEQPVGTTGAVNLLGRVEGTDASLRARHVLVGAHFDHIGNCNGAICNGANDNAAAVSLLLALACETARTPPARSVLFAAFDAEEPPAFLSDDMGSEYFAAHATVPVSDIDVAIIMDLVGGDLWPGYTGHFLLGAELSPQVTAVVEAATAPAGLKVHRAGLHLVERTRFGNQPWSDYDPFRNRNVPVLFISNGQNKMYHTPDDEPGTLAYPRMELQATLLQAITHALANATTTPVFEGAARNDVVDANTMHAVLTDALATGGMVDALSLSSQSRTTLQSDLADVAAIRDALNAGGTASTADVSTLRSATQRIMCFSGSSYTESTCNLL